VGPTNNLASLYQIVGGSFLGSVLISILASVRAGWWLMPLSSPTTIRLCAHPPSISRVIFKAITCPSAEHRAKVRTVTDEAVREYLSKLGRRGADATNNQLTPAQRKRKAKKAARARWGKVKKDLKHANP
jgi:hypothetical protein